MIVNVIVMIMVFVIVITCNESMYISSRLVLSFLDLTSSTNVIIGMTLYELVLHYHIIFHDLLSHLFCWLFLQSILFYLISNWFDSIPLIWILFTILFSIVPHINEWFVSICPSVYLSVLLLICIHKFDSIR